MLPVGAFYFYQAHVGRTVLPRWPIWALLFYSVLHNVSELRRACFRQARVTQAVILPGALFHAEAFAISPCAAVPLNPTCACSHIGVLRLRGFV